MDRKESGVIKDGEKDVATEPRSLAISERGVKTGGDFASLMSALMSDIIGGRVTPQVGNAACNAGGKLLKIVEMQYQYGKQIGTKGDRVLSLVPSEEELPVHLRRANDEHPLG